MEYFNYEAVAREAGLVPQRLEALCRVMRQEFPSDQMMVELHMLRVCRAIRDGDITSDEAVGVQHAQAA